MELLLIEDDEGVARVLAEAFIAEGHETTITHSYDTGDVGVTGQDQREIEIGGLSFNVFDGR